MRYVLSAMLLQLIFCCNLYAGFFGVSSYEECVIDGIKGDKDKDSVSAVKKSCADKFPIEDSELSEKYKDRLITNAQIVPTTIGDALQIDVLNQNEEKIVSSLVVVVVDKVTNESYEYDTKSSFKVANREIYPLSKGKFLVLLYDVPREWSWYLKRVGGK